MQHLTTRPSSTPEKVSQAHLSPARPSRQTFLADSDESTHDSEEKSMECGLLQLELEALNAFKNNDERAFIDTLSKTSSLHVRDKGVLLATEAGWTLAVQSLLRINTDSLYTEDIDHNDALMAHYFTHLVPTKHPYRVVKDG